MTLSDQDIERRIGEWTASLEPSPELFRRIEASLAVEPVHRRVRRFSAVAAVAAAIAVVAATVSLIAGSRQHMVTAPASPPPPTVVEWVLAANNLCAAVNQDPTFRNADDQLLYLGDNAPSRVQAPLMAAELPAYSRGIRGLIALGAPIGHERTIHILDQHALSILAGLQAVANAVHDRNQSRIQAAVDALNRTWGAPIPADVRLDLNTNFRGSCLGPF